MTKYYVQLKWLKIAERRELALGVMMFKLMKFDNPEYLSCSILRRAQVHCVPTRSARNTLQIPSHKTNFYGKSFSVLGAKFYNENVMLFNTDQSVIAFKKNLKDKLLARYVS